MPELGGGDTAPERPAGERENRRYRLFEAVAALLGAAAGERPLLLVVEDLQWAGRPTLLLLRHVVRRLHGSPLLVLVTLRDTEADPGGAPARLLADLSREHVVERMTLAGLEEGETAALVGDEELARSLQARTAGNPFFIEEMLRSLAEAPEDPPGVPEGVKELVSRRLARLAPATVETLTAGAVLGRDFGLATLEAMVARPGEELLGALEEGLRAGHRARGRRARRPLRLRARARARDALRRARPGAPGAAAPARRPGARGGGRAGGRARPPLLRRARGRRGRGGGRARRRGRAPRGGRARLRGGRVAPRAGAGGASARAARGGARAELLLALGDVRWQASEPGARAAFDDAAELARAEHAPDVLARAVLGAGGRFYMPTALDADYVARLEEALAALGDSDGSLRARLLARLAEHLALADAGERPGQLGGEAVAMARRGGDEGALAAALMGRHAALLDIEHAAVRLQVIDEALAIAERLEASELAALAQHWRIYDLVELGEVGEGVARARPAGGARARAAPAAVLARRARLARRLGAPGRPLRGGRADRARVAADRRGRRRAPGARVLPHAAVRRAPRAGAAGGADRRGRAARERARARWG